MNRALGRRLLRSAVSAARTGVRCAHQATQPQSTQSQATQPKSQQKSLEPFTPGYGEQIWVFSHRQTNQVVYSHMPTINSHNALKQLTWIAKKSKPAKLRRDYWSPMTMIEFEKGQGVIGRSVFQKMREFQRLHELSWEDDKLFKLTRQERAARLNDQRANAIADIAAVLAGAGRGNKIVLGVETKGLTTKVQTPKLAEARIFWARETDPLRAEKWSKNVKHHGGVPRPGPGDAREPVKELNLSNTTTPDKAESQAEAAQGGSDTASNATAQTAGQAATAPSAESAAPEPSAKKDRDITVEADKDSQSKAKPPP